MTITYELEYSEILHVMYFTDVKNKEEVTNKLTTHTYPFVNCTCINAQLILDPFQVLIAASKAVVGKHANSMITKSLPTELLFNLSLSENITASLETFGYGTKYGNNLLLAIFSRESKQCDDINEAVQGSLHVNFTNDSMNLSSIKKAYDINDEQLSASSLLNLIATKIACKSI